MDCKHNGLRPLVCGLCHEAEVERLKAENEQFKRQIRRDKIAFDDLVNQEIGYGKIRRELETKRDKLREALEGIAKGALSGVIRGIADKALKGGE